MDKIYDVLIVGGGAAGYTAAIYAGTAGLDALVLESVCTGGQMVYTPEIWNYPGFPEGVDGVTLANQMRKAADRFGVQTVSCKADGLEDGKIKTVTAGEKRFQGRTVIIATGADHRHLDVPGEKEFAGKGVSYCATCDGVLYRGKTVAVVGGGNGAVSDATFLSRLADKVILLHRRDTLRADAENAERMLKAGNVEIRYHSVVRELIGGERLSALVLESGEQIPVDGVFVSVGRVPETAFLQGTLAVDGQGYLPAGEDTKTELPGVFAAGDVRRKPLHQIVTAAADGAVAIHQVKHYLSEIM